MVTIFTEIFLGRQLHRCVIHIYMGLCAWENDIEWKVIIDDIHGCTVHVDNIKSFICPTNAHTNYSKIVELLKTFNVGAVIVVLKVFNNSTILE